MNVTLPTGPGQGGPARDVAELTEEQFARVAQLADRAAGLSIPTSKRSMVQSRLNRRLRATGSRDYEEYLAHFQGERGEAELPHLISALTTNVSHFFREDHHFTTLKDEILPHLMARAAAGGRVRIWSAGCSNGQEPHSIAMTLYEADDRAADYDIRILATDIDQAVLARARAGEYGPDQTAGIPTALARKWTEAAPGGDRIRVAARLRKLITFRHLNLIDPWPMRGQFDVVFCRNVIIYFSETTQQALWPRFAKALVPEGWLFLGHSERVSDPGTFGFRSRGVTSYQRVETSGQREGSREWR